eukprot:TRINITY_DN42128_c0_g1_i1.p1 TRINITY_DN42128_c0_g1~~TRINITY_DN42128_c0_g1_i1.p1  ORF type:complete len:243 (-),score=39.83 TRINITY_DN42128_c0_g1_i1:9-737(-)
MKFLLFSIVVFFGMCFAEEDTVATYVPFRCRRALDQIASLKPKHTPRSASCFLGPIEVLEATAIPAVTHEGQPGIEFRLRATLERQLLVAAYQIQLTVLATGSAVNYEGMDGEGYNMCCRFVDGAECEWVKNEATGLMEQRVNKCIMRTEEQEILDAREAGKEVVFSGRIVKPLHNSTPGLWEVRFTILDGFGSKIGQVLAYTRIGESHLSKGDPPKDTTTGAESEKTDSQNFPLVVVDPKP